MAADSTHVAIGYIQHFNVALVFLLVFMCL